MLKKYFLDFSNGTLQASNYLKCQLVSQEKQICSCLETVEQGGQRTAMGKRVWFIFFA